MTCTCSCLSPFLWNTGEPSIFSTEKHFTGMSTGKTMRQISSESADTFQKRYGRSLGTIGGLSPAADRDSEERSYMRRKAGA